MQQQACAYHQQGGNGSQHPSVDGVHNVLPSSSQGALDPVSNTNTTQTVLRERLEKEVAVVRYPMLRQAMLQTFAEMLQGTGPTFRALQGGLRYLSTSPPSRTFTDRGSWRRALRMSTLPPLAPSVACA